MKEGTALNVRALTQRLAETEIRPTIDRDKRTVELSFSSETPIRRNVWNAAGSIEAAVDLAEQIGSDEFFEVLGHREEEVDLSRLNNAGPLLRNHDAKDHIGVLSNALIRDGKGYATAKISRNAEAAMNDIEDGILMSTSVGASVLRYEVTGYRDGIPVLRATKWTPREVSLLSMGADVTVGVNRSEYETARAEKINLKKGAKMANEDNNKPDASPEKQRANIEAEIKRGVEAERKRIAKVHEAIEFCRTDRGLDIPNDVRAKADENEWGYDQTVAHILRNQPERNIGADTRILDTMQREERHTFSLTRAIAGHLSGRLDGFEGEVVRELEKEFGGKGKSDGGLLVPYSALSQRGLYESHRSMLAGVYSQGGSTVPVDTGPMIPKLDPVAVVEQAGGTFLRGLTAPTNFPRHTTAAVAQWVAEAQEVAKSTPGTDDVLVTPHGLAAYVEISRQLALTSSIDIEAFVRTEILRRINLAIDKAALTGPGTSGVPKGVFELDTATSGINTVTFGAAPTWSKIVEFEGEVEDADALMGSLSWVTSAPVKAKWKATSKDTGSGIFLATAENTANGYPIYVTSQLAGTDYANRVVFGNFSDLLVGMYGAIELFFDQSAALQRRGLIGITGLAHADVAFRHPESFAVSTDAGNQ